MGKLEGILNRKPVGERSAFKNHLVATLSEFVGTFLFLFFAFCVQQMAIAQADGTGPGGSNSSSTVIYISLGYGFSLLVTAWTMYRVSGGLFNPAITLGLMITGNVPFVRGLFYMPAQIIAGMAAAGLTSAILPGPAANLRTSLAPGMSSAQGVFLEMFLTVELMYTVLMLAAEKSKDTYLAPIGIGMSLFVAEIAGVYYTGASLNPARSFGPCVAARSFQEYHWIYWANDTSIGPILGALLASGYYGLLKFLRYEEANPGQDSANGDFDSN